MDKKLFVCKDYWLRQAACRHRGTSGPPRFEAPYEVMTGWKFVDKIFFTKPPPTSQLAPSRRVGRIGRRAPRGVSRARGERLVLRPPATFGHDPRSTALGKNDITDHPQRVGQKGSGGVHLDKPG